MGFKVRRGVLSGKAPGKKARVGLLSVMAGGLIVIMAALPAAAGASTAVGLPASSCSYVSPAAESTVGDALWGHRTVTRTSCPTPGVGGPTAPSSAYNGTPPLTFHGGAVTGTTTPGELTVTPVYWIPKGSTIPTAYESLINRFIADAAADSGKTTNVFSNLTQYTNAGGKNLSYKLHAGAPVTDTTKFPTNGCTPDSGRIWSDGTAYSNCITNAQLLSEASAFTTSHDLANNDLAHLYMYFLPKGVETCFTSTNGAGGGECSINAKGGFCGYHAFGSPPLVADMNYAVVDSPLGWTCSSDGGSNTGGNQSPNGNIDADSEISITSHEISETITDPQGSAWLDSSGNEVADDCAYIYGDSLSFQGSPGALRNQTINGHGYFLQEEFSNQDFAAKRAYSCIQQEEAAAISPISGPTKTSVVVSGSGFASGETIKADFYASLTKKVLICTTTATGTGSFSCTGKIKKAPLGLHYIGASGSTSLRQAYSLFDLT